MNSRHLRREFAVRLKAGDYWGAVCMLDRSGAMHGRREKTQVNWILARRRKERRNERGAD